MERLGGAVIHITLTALIYGQVLIVATDADEGIVESRLTVFLLGARLIVVGIVVARWLDGIVGGII